MRTSFLSPLTVHYFTPPHTAILFAKGGSVWEERQVCLGSGDWGSRFLLIGSLRNDGVDGNIKDNATNQ